MLVSTSQLLTRARDGRYAVGAFNVYHLEGVLAVVAAAEVLESPVILQALPAALDLGETLHFSLSGGRSGIVRAGGRPSGPLSLAGDHPKCPLGWHLLGDGGRLPS